MISFFLKVIPISIHSVIKAFLIFFIMSLSLMGAKSFFTNAQPVKKNGYVTVEADLYSRLLFDYLGGITYQENIDSPVDSGGVNFLVNMPLNYANLDIKIGLKFEDQDTNSIQQLRFDETYIQINDIYNFMDIKFFDIGYGAGMGNSIRPDLPVHGIQFYFHLISELTLSLGYGIASTDLQLHPTGTNNNYAQPTLNGIATTYIPSYHTLKLDILYNNIYVPFGFYYGIVLVGKQSSYLVKDYLPENINDSILHTSVGFSVDFLAYYKKKAFAFDIGFGLPIGTMSRYIYLKKDEGHNYDTEFNFLFQFYGDVDILYGIGLAYQILFALDTHTKQKTLGNLYDAYFKETFKVSLIPRYTYGPLLVDLGMVFGIVGDKTARSSYTYKDSIIFNNNGSYLNFTVETGIEWTPFPFKGIGKDFSIRGYYKANLGDLDNGGDHFNEIGMMLKLKFDTREID